MIVRTALLDACVLYSAPLRDLLLHLSHAGLFRARWTWKIHDEWIAAVLRDRPDLSRRQLERTRDLMNAAILDCLVERFEDLIESVNLPDPSDRHVLAAAIRASADVIVTSNLAHFPRSELARHGLEALHPDEFIWQLIDLAPARACAAARNHRTALKRPAKSVDEYLETLLRQSLPRTVAALRVFADLI